MRTIIGNSVMSEILSLFNSNEQDVSIQRAIDSCVKEISVTIHCSIREQLTEALSDKNVSS